MDILNQTMSQACDQEAENLDQGSEEIVGCRFYPELKLKHRHFTV